MVAIAAALFLIGAGDCFAIDRHQDELFRFGRALFFSTALSNDHNVSCSSCHVPEHAYADTRSVSIGVHGAAGTRNAPSLIGIAHDKAFFWDGRRTQLQQAVLDPFTNPVEFGLSSRDEIAKRIVDDAELSAAFRSAFGDGFPMVPQVSFALSAFVDSLTTGTSAFDDMETHRTALSIQAQHGRELFEGIAGCSQCHHVEPALRFDDDDYHFTSAPSADSSHSLANLAREVVSLSLSDAELGSRVLSDARWASLGRFVVTKNPSDIGAYRTPSLRNVALTAPYMHDGHIATLEEAVDHEVYYRVRNADHAAQVTESERSAIVAFLRSLSDFEIHKTKVDGPVSLNTH